MSLSSHIGQLQKKHRALHDRIEEAEKHPATDDLEIHEMKRQKLHIKEEIARLGGSV